MGPSGTMTIRRALRELGVRDGLLSDRERAALDVDGFVLLPGVLDAGQVDRLNARTAELLAAEGDRAGLEVHQEAGADRLANLVDKDPLFDAVVTHPRVLAAVAHVLSEDVKLFSLNYRAALPGQGQQKLHRDSGEPFSRGHYHVCNSIWLLDDFTEVNGPTRVVPGSHLPGPDGRAAQADDAGLRTATITGPAGSVAVFNSHALHGGTHNASGAPRRALHCAYVRRHGRQQTDQRRHLRPATVGRLSPAARFLLDV